MGKFAAARGAASLGILLGAMALGPGSALADQHEDQGLYVGASYGFTKIRGSEFSDTNDVPQFFVGWQANPFIGAEAAYMEFGGYGSGPLRASTRGYNLSITGRVPLTEQLALYSKVGRFFWDTRVRSGTFRENFKSSELSFGAGVMIEIAPQLDVRVSWERLEVDLGVNGLGPVDAGSFASKLDMVSVGVQLEF